MMHLMIAGAIALGAAQVPQVPAPAPAPRPATPGAAPRAAAAAPRAQQVRLDTTFSVRPGGRIDIENQSGLVTVRSWERNEVHVQAAHAGNAVVEADLSGNTVSVEAGGPPRNRVDTNVTLTISVPRSFRVNVEGINAHINIENIDADVTAETVNGNVGVKSVAGRVTAEAVSGAVVVEGVRGNVSVSSTNQNVRVLNVVGTIAAETVNGSITILNAESSNVTAETVNGGIVMGTTVRDGGTYAAATTNGNIHFGVSTTTNATIEGSTFSGRLVTSLSIPLDRRRTGSYTVRMGNGSAQVDLETFAGTISLVRPEELNSLGQVRNQRAPRVDQQP